MRRRKTYEVSVVVCDIGNKVLFAEGPSPAPSLKPRQSSFVKLLRVSVEEGAYLQAADGEGVVGIFGFPVHEPDHAQKAATLFST